MVTGVVFARARVDERAEGGVEVDDRFLGARGRDVAVDGVEDVEETSRAKGEVARARHGDRARGAM